MVDNLIVKGTAEDGMGMANERSEWSIGSAQVQDRFYAARRTSEHDTADGACGRGFCGVRYRMGTRWKGLAHWPLRTRIRKLVI
jgi:hypothetical protein